MCGWRSFKTGYVWMERRSDDDDAVAVAVAVAVDVVAAAAAVGVVGVVDPAVAAAVDPAADALYTLVGNTSDNDTVSLSVVDHTAAVTVLGLVDQ
jgi:hypothetical protein